MDNKDNNHKPDIIDEDLYEEFDDEELYELVQEERKKALEKAKNRKNTSTKRPFPKWAFWLIAIAMFINVFALIPQTYSIPAIEFLKTSANLMMNEDIQSYKKAVVVVESEDNKGTGFAISSNGTILTNYHVIEDKNHLAVAFPDDGLFEAEIIEEHPSIDLAVLKVEGEDLPYLELAHNAEISPNEAIKFIGNPLRFNGIANEGNIIGYTQLDDWDEQVVMLEAPVYRGNSGSPIINSNGEVIGVIFATLNSDMYGKVGLFVPIDLFYKYQT
ncbi:S1C family serine protease [Oceanobacillus halophilus]|uniref:Serine protease n=1 Tax=Oceanobacillus halophilus TaxID=930130 RepID=A0A494ZYM1_9BACI|nr:serine protease [Oceanobacillus halophilus]RKQ31239.1 serine protease [Oceanobacillus halophilus]